MVDKFELSAAIDDFCSALTDDFAASDILVQLASSTLDVLQVDGAGVMVVEKNELTRYAYATGPDVEGLERLQEVLQNGPCRDAYRRGEVVNIADLAIEGEWPTYQRSAVECGLHAVTAVPLQARGRGWGVLDVYRRDSRRLDADELRAATTLARLAVSYLMVAEDRDAARAAQHQLAQLAMHDPLTGLPVRWVFLEHLARSLADLDRHDSAVAVLFLDLDGLKYVNDTRGHPAGDDLLIECSRRIRTAVRPGDVVARIGGDEFVVLLDAVTEEDATTVARRILDGLRATDAAPVGDTSPISASIGIAITTESTQRPDTLVAHADAAMYAAKRSGAGRSAIFDPVRYDAERAAESFRAQIGAAIRSAVPDEQFELHYQPILDVRGSGSTFAVEALLRWRHPQRGLLAAATFLPAVENTPLMADVGVWVVETACRQLSDWDRRLGARAPGRMFVNLSVAELSRPGLDRVVERAIACAGLTPDRLTLEVTETGLAMNAAVVLETVETMRTFGCGIAIDDFGSGYSSLSRLERMPADVLKVDASFARDLHVSPAAGAIVSAVLLLGRSLDRTVIVEGAEDQRTVQTLVDLGVTHLQGFQLGRPMPAVALEEMLAGRNP